MALDQHGLEPEVGGAERGGVAAGAGAEHDHVGLDVGVGRGLGLGAARAAAASAAGALPSSEALPSASAPSSMQDQAPHRDRVPDLHLQLLDDARGRRGHVHRRLVGLERDQRVLGRDLVARGDEDLDDRDVGEVADVRDLDLDHSSTLRMSSRMVTRYFTKRAAAAPSITRWS